MEKEILPFPSVHTDAAMRDIALYATARKQSYRPPEILEKGMPELVRQYVKWKELLEEKKEAYEWDKDRLATAAMQLTPYMIDCSKAVCGDVKMRWKQRTTRPVDLDGLKLAYSEIYARFVTENVTTSFDIDLKIPVKYRKDKEGHNAKRKNERAVARHGDSRRKRDGDPSGKGKHSAAKG